MNEIGNAIRYLFLLLICFLPLGIWKAVEIIIWIYSHIGWK